MLAEAIKKKLHDTYINYSYKKIIHIEDGKVKINQNDNNQKLNELIDNGIIEIDSFKISNEDAEYSNIYADDYLSKLKNVKTPLVNIPFTIKKDSIIESFLTDKNFNHIIKSYIGPDAQLDLVQMTVTSNREDAKIISEKWHYDNVGRRLKVFIYLNDNNKICTDYISKTNNLIHKKYSTNDSRIAENDIKAFVEDARSYYPKLGKILIFDTNGFHRGNYKNDKNAYNKETTFRKMLKLEFSNKLKSDRFYGKSNSIGVRNTFFSKDFNFENCQLINKKYLTEFEDLFYYDKLYATY